ncbi:threonine aldolase family protein [Niabella beijingensis]|uniref:threonine aldolase family protein n=1 Tax=Niabella beijingensis TaxID=2872700 RepID=UPI001CBDE08D|nr:GntG family PLP-dependent aldolase [Niabella beijingensis]MBZ4191079.1 DegT/DnrJ/EryC1/StrS family aminotransferase [Niabella beijingensis]
MIDLRSDTVTRPSPGMLQAMLQAETGDDVFREDPTVNELEARCAALFGMEAALFCSSGTQTNQIAIKCHTQPGDEVICEANAHIYLYEAGGISFNSGASVRLLPGDRGRINATQVAAAINPDDVHKAVSRLVCIENTSNRGGGSCYSFEALLAIRAVCDANALGFHLDGARLFNALVARDETPQQYGNLFDSISVCFSKSLGCPVGSVLLGTRPFIAKARRIRKLLGGGMRQAGILAAAGLYALEHHINKLKTDHIHAAVIAGALQHCSFVENILPVETNIIIFETRGISAPDLAARLRKENILCNATGPDSIRFVLHLDITEAMVHQVVKALHSIKKND